MIDTHLFLTAMQIILQTLEEGVHIVDADGRSVLYNRAMEHIEGLSAEEVLGKHLLEVFPTWLASDSTLLTALAMGRTINQQRQSYLNFKKKRISTVNATYPIILGSQIVGAVEVAKNYTEVNQLSEQIIDLRQKLIDPPKAQSRKPRRYTFDMLIGRHPQYMNAIGIARKAAGTDSNVLIEGETGTGKELFAQSIHNECERNGRPFIAVNCAAMPDALLEGIFFGTSKGSYTGAEERPGLFEQANGGTLFLDEINSMSLPLQAKILRAIQECSVRRLGGLKDLFVDVRIIAASNESLHDMMRAGTFRKDLYYRINVINIKIPALRERRDDIPLLAEHFLRYYNQKIGKDVWMLSAELVELFREHAWAGNVRELQNVLESAMTMVSTEHVLGCEHVPSHVDLLAARPVSQGSAGMMPSAEGFRGNLPAYLEDVERAILRECLAQSGGNISSAARLAGISRQSLQYKMKCLGLLPEA